MRDNTAPRMFYSMQSVLNLNILLVRRSFDLKALPYPFQATEFEFCCVNLVFIHT